ncbi:MAG: hypothetical protein KZQ70_09865, partial [gamma proteobacterium symbiont of Lucinoma myriamae]|nr:hypothetical protein [gamma proteobacterium symbiont of Lucinoma myriamae]MCU7820010.1 hypothetical protein [gamma proteobacterium symbiont of Lucinoma myriamae]MCU7832791.1 hypothetical protein [gamma proteobacterium symbiont of Lucinoma myriamae]
MNIKALIAIIILLLSLSAHAQDDIWVLIDTKKLILEVKLADVTLVKFANISIGRNGSGFKRKRGDDITPKGTYKIAWINRKSRYHIFFGFNYPSKENAQQALEKGLLNKKSYSKIIKAHNRVATGFSPTAPTPPIMRVRNGRFTNRNE